MESPGQFGSAVLILSPPKTLLSPSLLMGGRVLENSSDAEPVLPRNSQNSGVLPRAFQLPRHSTTLWGLKWGKWTPSQPDSVYPGTALMGGDQSD